jgi:hypothetical protein
MTSIKNQMVENTFERKQYYAYEKSIQEITVGVLIVRRHFALETVWTQAA